MEKKESVFSRRSEKISMRWKFIYYGLIIFCIPLILLSFFFIMDKRNANVQTEQARYMAAASSAAETFLHNVQAMQSVALMMDTEIRLQDRTLNTSTYNNILAIRILNSYKNTLPLTAACGLYSEKTPNLIYYSDAIWYKSVFQKCIITHPGLLEAALACPSQVNFSPWSVSEDACLCTIPLRVPGRVAIFQLSSHTLLNSFSMLTDGIAGSTVAAIWDTDGKMIFYNSGCGASMDEAARMRGSAAGSASGNLYFCYGSSGNYGVLICAPYSDYLARVRSFSTSLTMVLIIELVLCVVLICAFAYINYRPLSKLMSSIGIQSDRMRGYEYGMIQDEYAKSSHRVRELTVKNEESSRLLLSYVLEKLLNGQTLNASEQQVLSEKFREGNGCYFVAVTPIASDQAAVIPVQLETPLGLIYPAVVRGDGFIVYLCRVENVNYYAPIAQLINRHAGHAISVGSIGMGLEHIHVSYLEAILAFNRGLEKQIAYFEVPRSLDGEMDLENKSLNIMQLARQIKSGDASVLDALNETFDTIVMGDCASATKKYQCFRLIEKLQESLNKLDMSMGDETAAQIMNAGNPELIRKTCLDSVSTLLERARLANAEQDRMATEQLMNIIEEKLDNSALNLSMLSSLANVPEITAGRLIKDATGLNLQEYLRRRRLETARELLLHSDDPITKIADDVGFNSCSYFIRVFKAEEGMTPSAYRALNNGPSL